MFDKIFNSETPFAWPLRYWLVALVSLIIATAATLLCKKIALRLSIVDKPDNLVKTHHKPIPYLGGIGIFAGLAAGLLTALIFLPADCPGITSKWLLGIIVAGAIVCVVGCIDDISDIRPWQKVLGQVAAALVLVTVGITPMLYTLDQPVKLVADTVFVIVFVLGATNSLNLLDGLDGLCAGVTAICALGMLLLATLMGSTQAGGIGDPSRAVVCLALLGSVCGFLPFNYHPAKIFMGDAGSLVLGLIMAALMILFAEKTPQFWLGSIVIFGLPILDTSVAFARRILNKRPLFISDRGHIYDQMMDRGLSLNKTVWTCYGLTAVYAITGILIGMLPIFAAVAVCSAAVLVSALAVWKKGYLKMTGLRGTVQQNSPNHSAGNRVD
jgi:UDP-GlcNAc:undecaprenyl-phosphate GlcNAc-1-phosphate transferase